MSFSPHIVYNGPMDKLSLGFVSTIESLIPEQFIVVTDLSTGVTEISDHVRDFLGLKDNVFEDFFNRLTFFVHPYDRPEYTEGMERRLKLECLEDEFCIRIGKNLRYRMYSFHTRVYEEEGQKYLVTMLLDEDAQPNFDYMTDLYAKGRFESDLSYVIGNRLPCTVLLVNLDYMEDINMLYGQNCGSSLYKDVALRFIYMTDADTAVYRVNDAGFTFLLKGAGREKTEDYAVRIRKCLEEEVYFQGRLLPLRSSMSAIVLDNYEEAADSVQGKLEYAARISRTGHRGGLVFFNDLVKIGKNSNLDVIKVIHRSVQSGCRGFFVEYQPIVNAATGDIEGAEALVRWKMDPYGTVPPGLFIGWMENNSCMTELGNHVLKTALTEMKPVLRYKPDFFVNVNISEKQLERPEFRKVVFDLLAQTGFPKKNLCLELTERCKNLPLDTLREEISFFRENGIRVALDDYGTGSSSSSVVLNVPVDEIKIDMSFVKGITENEKQQCLVKSIIDFANRAGLYSCIEGVEDEKLEEYLRTLHSTWFQGYHYSKPIVATELITKYFLNK